MRILTITVVVIMLASRSSGSRIKTVQVWHPYLHNTLNNFKKTLGLCEYPLSKK